MRQKQEHIFKINTKEDSLIYKLFLTVTLFISFVANAQNVTDVKIKEIPLEVVVGIDVLKKFDFDYSPTIQQSDAGQLLKLDLLPSKREITFRGLRPGKSSVTIRDRAGDPKVKFNVSITANSDSKMVQELRDLIGDVEGIEIGIRGGKVFVGGKIVVPSDIGRVAVVLADPAYDSVLRLVELSPQTLRIIAKKMQDEIQGPSGGMKTVTVRVVNNQFWIEGFVTSQGLFQKAERIVQSYIPDKIDKLSRQSERVQEVAKPIYQNFISINTKQEKKPIPKLIKITAQFVELTKDYLKTFGFEWRPTLGGNGGQINIFKTNDGSVTSRTTNDSLAATIGNLFPKLNSAKNAGYARIIQSGMIILKNNGKGTIDKKSNKRFVQASGTEAVQTGNAEAGFTVTINRVSIIQEEQIDLDLRVVVSSNIGNPPETLSNTITTQLVVKSKESAAIGGIVISKNATDFDKHPPSGELEAGEDSSFLFQFIRSKQTISSKSQFAVFITPEIIENASAGTEEIKRKFKRRRR